MNALLQHTSARWLGFVFLIALLALGIFLSIVLGVVDTSWRTALDAYLHFNGSNEQIVIRDVRVPRALIAAAVGASLGLSGVLMQVLTRNPLSDPGIFGINSGASFFVVSAMTLFSFDSLSQYTWMAFLGAAVSGGIVYLLGSLGRDGLTPMKLTLAGAALAALFASFTNGLLLINQRALEEVLFWISGSVAGRSLEMLSTVLPYLVIGWLGSFLMAGQLQTLMMGDDVAKGLGQRTVFVKSITGLLVILLAGGSVAVAGPIGFVGLIIPHIARYLIGTHMLWTLAYSALIGAVLLLGADIGARLIAMPKELPLGVMTAMIGTPFFVYVARKGLTRA
ncbi:MAG: iron ABC transporter permease [Tumebacillaceae bacterium]